MPCHRPTVAFIRLESRPLYDPVDQFCHRAVFRAGARKHSAVWGRAEGDSSTIVIQPFAFDGEREVSFIDFRFRGVFRIDDPAMDWQGNWRFEPEWLKKHELIFSSTPGDAIEVTFNGSCVYMQANLHSSYGIVDIYLDGELAESRDLYIESQWDNCAQSTAVWLTGLSGGKHTLRAEVSGRKNDESNGVGMALGRVVSYEGRVAPLPGWRVKMGENGVENEVLQAFRDYNAAFERQDIEGQVNFYSEAWQGGTGGRQSLRKHLQAQRGKGTLEVKHFALDDAEISMHGDTAIVEPVRLRAPSGGGLFRFKLNREPDGVFRCVHFKLVTEPDLDAQTARAVRERIASDPARPGYHFVVPEGKAMPFDPNGAIYWQGRYHLFYIFQDMRSGEAADHWGHMSSVDLFHWRHHPTGLRKGMYSGNCFVNKGGIPTMCYHQKGEGNAMAVALDNDLNEWKKLDSNPITPKTEPGDEHHGKYNSWDPYGWLENDTYYAIFGGKRPGIAKSSTLEGPWSYTGDLFAHGVDGVALDEDVSCADLFKLGDKHVLLCISHRMGCRYYVGEWRDEQFYPESHAQMSWVDHTFFAPESLVDDKGRRIMWAWLMDEPSFGVRAPYGWSGTMSLPRVLSLGDGGLLRIDVPEEIERLRCGEFTSGPVTLEADTELLVDEVAGDSIELQIEFENHDTGCYGVKVRVSDDGEEETLVYFDAETNELKVDTRKSGPEDGVFVGTPRVVEAAPLELADGERLLLRVFVDKSVVEVFANSRQAIARRIYPLRQDSVGVRLFANGGNAQVRSLAAWQIAPSNPQ